MQDMGALGTPLMYAFRERERIVDLFEALSGARMMYNYMRFGGCRVDLPAGWIQEAKDVVTHYLYFLDEFERLLNENEILIARTQGVGVLKPELAINASITGPMLRATGVNYDLRKVDKYGIYDRFDFRVPLGEHGDVFRPLHGRVLEMRESLKILERALADIPEGPIIDPKYKVRNFKPKIGESYGRIEGPKGELGFYVISDGRPIRIAIGFGPPSFINLTVLEDMCLGQSIADAVIILGSVDIVLGEVDRDMLGKGLIKEWVKLPRTSLAAIPIRSA
jgi:NADH-quinone oxidoreductase subunit D